MRHRDSIFYPFALAIAVLGAVTGIVMHLSVRGPVRQALERIEQAPLEVVNEEAVRIAERHTGPIHLLLTDVVMPGMSGRELAERLASLRAGLPALYISGYTDDAIVHHGVLDPGTAFLEKPTTEEWRSCADHRGHVGVSMNAWKFRYDDILPLVRDVPVNPEREEKELPDAVRLLLRSSPDGVTSIPISEHVPDLTHPEDIARVSLDLDISNDHPSQEYP